MGGIVPNIPVPQDFDRTALRREVGEKVQRFLDGASPASPPEGGEAKRNNGRALKQAISGLAGSREAIYAIRGDGDLQVGEAAAVCFVGSQEVILLRIFYRTDRNVQQVYEYALCYQERGRSPIKWTDARGFYQTFARRQRAEAPPIEIDMVKVRSTAEALLARLKAHGRDFKPKGAQLEGAEVESQIRSLNVAFTLGVDDARTAGLGSYRVICFIGEGSGLSLRIFRHDASGWLYATYVLDVSYSRPNAQNRGRRGDIEEYRWDSV